ncbi:hypothetical protein K439DRAFT_1615390 [Ramaria rubella]|nr:hypothetical protein K439DRAFT_1615390 [Ramaria rubella]
MSTIPPSGTPDQGITPSGCPTGMASVDGSFNNSTDTGRPVMKEKKKKVTRKKGGKPKNVAGPQPQSKLNVEPDIDPAFLVPAEPSAGRSTVVNRDYYPLPHHQKQFDQLESTDPEAVAEREKYSLRRLQDGGHKGDGRGRPPHGVREILLCAILGSPNRRLTLREIRVSFRRRFAFFANKHEVGWRNSIRNYLTTKDWFEKIPRPPSDPGPPGSWWIVIADIEQLNFEPNFELALEEEEQTEAGSGSETGTEAEGPAAPHAPETDKRTPQADTEVPWTGMISTFSATPGSAVRFIPTHFDTNAVTGRPQRCPPSGPSESRSGGGFTPPTHVTPDARNDQPRTAYNVTPAPLPLPQYPGPPSNSGGWYTQSTLPSIRETGLLDVSLPAGPPPPSRTIDGRHQLRYPQRPLENQNRHSVLPSIRDIGLPGLNFPPSMHPRPHPPTMAHHHYQTQPPQNPQLSIRVDPTLRSIPSGPFVTRADSGNTAWPPLPAGPSSFPNDYARRGQSQYQLPSQQITTHYASSQDLPPNLGTSIGGSGQSQFTARDGGEDLTRRTYGPRSGEREGRGY